MLKKIEIIGYDVTCPKCGYNWVYRGDSDNRITCSKCKYVMHLKDL